MDLVQVPADYFKFCEGEEHIKISNAICRGRRRANFPKCAGCQFNEDFQSASMTGGASPLRNTRDVESVFGSENIAATSPSPLSTDVAWRIGHAAGQYLHGKLRGYERAHPGSRSVVVGRDMRSSGVALAAALIDGIRSVGMDVIDIGLVDTPQLHFAVCQFNACGGIHTTGGGLPSEQNGFRLCGAKAAPISDQTGLSGIRDIAIRVPKHQTGLTARLREASVANEYRSLVQSPLVGHHSKRPLKIVLDAANGVASRLAPVLFEGLDTISLEMTNAEVMEPFAHTPDPTIAANLVSLRNLVKARKADFGVSLSGDGSQCAFVDERSMWVPPDWIGTLLARSILERQRGAAVVIDVRSSIIAADEITRAGGIAIRERAGYQHLRKRMVEANAAFGFDCSGRFYFRDGSGGESPFHAIMHLVRILNTNGGSLSSLIQPIARTRTSGEVTLRCDKPDDALERLVGLHQEAQVERLDGITLRFDDWRTHLRALEGESAIRVIVEARTKKLVDQRLAEIGRIATPDATDSRPG